MLLMVTITFLLFYALLIFYYFYHWLHIREYSSTNNGKIFTSILIAARNEEKNIANLLNALLQQNYSSDFFEIIIVDDYSTDKTAEVVKGFSNQHIHLIQPNAEAAVSSKKKAIEAGLQKAKGD
jgi:cellulose synthase/poly-beta-1,6-N-acetylglucosamine synthase-like glycosyltransferase